MAEKLTTGVVAEKASEAGPSRGEYLWLTLLISGTAYLGFSLTYFVPVFAGTYPDVSAAVHLHGWSFFAWYLLLPVQAGLIRTRRIKVHRWLGQGSLVLAALMVLTGLLVLGVQVDLAQQPGGDTFWLFLGPTIFVSLLLFVGFYAAAFRNRRRSAEHKRLIILASTGGLGAATFRIFGIAFGYATWSQVVGVLAPNLLLIVAVAIDWRRGKELHRTYKVGVPVSILATTIALVIVPTPLGDLTADLLSFVGRALNVLY